MKDEAIALLKLIFVSFVREINHLKIFANELCLITGRQNRNFRLRSNL